MSVNKELVKGSTSMLVLGVLEEKEMYGYQIIKELEQRSETVFSLKEGTLYPILHVLEQDGFLEAYWEDTSSARKRRFYRITKKGGRKRVGQTERGMEGICRSSRKRCCSCKMRDMRKRWHSVLLNISDLKYMRKGKVIL
mgnify:CR=1 FL=1